MPVRSPKPLMFVDADEKAIALDQSDRPCEAETEHYHPALGRNTDKERQHRDTRLYLTNSEVSRLIAAARTVGRHRERDSTLILMGYRHGLRCREIANLRWEDVDLEQRTIYIQRLKRGESCHHLLAGDEIRALRRVQRQSTKYGNGGFIFCSEQNYRISENAIWMIVRRAGRVAGVPFPTHPHQLRHACGYHLASKGLSPLQIQAYLGHKEIRHTLHYCKLAPEQFIDLWD